MHVYVHANKRLLVQLHDPCGVVTEDRVMTLYRISMHVACTMYNHNYPELK